MTGGKWGAFGRSKTCSEGFVRGGRGGNMVLVEASVARRYWGRFAKEISGLRDGVRLKFNPRVAGCIAWRVSVGSNLGVDRLR